MGAFADQRALATEDAVGYGHATKEDTVNRLALTTLNAQGHLKTLPGILVRSRFRWKDADEIYIGPGVYHLDGTDEIIVSWDSELTFAFSGLSGDQWQYLYIDDSAVQTLGSTTLTASQFINSSTAPTWSASKHGWYNGSDRCIFAVLVSSGSILNFYHQNDFVTYDEPVAELSGSDIDDAWTDVTLSVPGLGDGLRALLSFLVTNTDEKRELFVRKNGSSASTYAQIAVVSESNATEDVNDTIVTTDSTQTIEVKFALPGSSTLAVFTIGFYLPIGL